MPKNDEFFNEYVPKNKDRLKFISNFSGSYGIALILKDKNFLFVDGRYTSQAQRESGKSFIIKTIPNFLPKNIFKKNKLKIGFDSKLITKKFLEVFFKTNNCKLQNINENLIDKIWKRKSNHKVCKFYILSKNSNSQSYKIKIKKVISNIIKQKADYQFISSSENISWLMNIRGKDSIYSPITNSYVLINRNKKIKFFCDLKKVSNSFKNNFRNVDFIDIKLIHLELLRLRDKKVIIDSNTCSQYFENLILIRNSLIHQKDKISELKAIKTNQEIKNIKKAHIYDGAALTKFIFWLQKNYNKKKVTEIYADKKLHSYRKKNRSFKFLSFPTISGTGPNGAIIHYRATKKTNLRLKKGDIYLVDSGGQYNYGTTDVTRTISLNNSNKRIKNIFTRVLKGHIAVSSFKLDNKTSGSKIDKVARKYLKQINLDYAHGTGHGVGYFLSVHEGPQAISKNNFIYFKEGMVVSNEPGYYEKNKFGIRIENLIYVQKVKDRLFFKNLTMAPIDKNLIDLSILTMSKKTGLINTIKQYFIILKDL